ncbi:MAG: hypothetical protein GTO02_16410 [Candidatus Dadabacteria bacterium]|nr:hypothetical protein [Candidatus Dadabacteria bacterium]
MTELQIIQNPLYTIYTILIYDNPVLDSRMTTITVNSSRVVNKVVDHGGVQYSPILTSQLLPFSIKECITDNGGEGIKRNGVDIDF